MKKAREYRQKAHLYCENQIGTLALSYFIISLIVGASSGIGFIIVGPLTAGFAMLIVKNYQNQKIEVATLFDGFKDFVKYLVLGLLQYIYILLWTLCLIIPGIIKSFSYSMAYYISLDHPELDADQCITRSREIMDGHKWKLFCLQFSYIGWMFLCFLTFGILTFWVYPRMETAKYDFYCDLVGKTEQPLVNEPVEAQEEYTAE